MSLAAPTLLIGAVAAVGVLHTVVPDHWLPITLYARQAHWTKRRTALAAAGAGLGHTMSTLLLGLIVWAAGALAARRYGHLISMLSSFALIAFGLWIAIGGLRTARGGQHPHAHEPHYGHEHMHAPPSQQLALMLILGSSPMVEGIPAFFAASAYGAGLLAIMAVVFAVSTIATYVLLCVASVAGLQRLHLGAFERYGEVLSGVIIALLGIVFFFS